MLSRRQFLQGLALSGVAGCATNTRSNLLDQDSAYTLVSKTLASRKPPAGRYPLTTAQILDIPYATLGVRVDENPRVVMVLSTIDGRAQQWISSDFVSFVTRDGWLLKTHGLKRDLAATRWLPAMDQNPLAAFGRTGQLPPRGVYRQIDLKHADERDIEVDSRFESAADETILVLGEEHPTRRIDEIASVRAWRWEVRNRFWVDPESGKVRRSVQQYCPEIAPIEMEVLRPAAA